MENRKQVGGCGGGSWSFTNDLFGPRETLTPPTSSSSTGVFGSVFDLPPSMGQRRDSLIKHDLGSKYGNGKHGTSDSDNNVATRGKGEGNKPEEPCYFSSSIYYGAQDVYSPNGQIVVSQHVFKKDGGDKDSASRGNWWQGSLYY